MVGRLATPIFSNTDLNPAMDPFGNHRVSGTMAVAGFEAQRERALPVLRL